MNRKTINLIISFSALIIFFVWGWIEGSYQHSWLIFIVAGIAIAFISIYDKESGKKSE